MWVTLLFTVLNVALSLIGKKALRVNGLDLTPFGIIMIAQAGESIFLGALLLTAAYSFHSLKELRFLWLTVPATLIIGYLSLAVPNPYLLIILYHGLCAVTAFFLQAFGARYTVFLLVNLGLNFAAARIVSLFG